MQKILFKHAQIKTKIAIFFSDKKILADIYEAVSTIAKALIDNFGTDIIRWFIKLFK